METRPATAKSHLLGDDDHEVIVETPCGATVNVRCSVPGDLTVDDSVTLVEALRERGVEVEQLVFPDEVHGFLTHRRWLEAYRATADVFRRKLMGGEE